MISKPTTADGYSGDALKRVRQTCLYVATKLGDLLDEVVVVGGLVPSLIIPQPSQAKTHVGTMDVDLGLALALLDAQRYHEICERLRGAGFEPDTNEQGKETNQRWRIAAEGGTVSIDFLIPPTAETDQGGRLKNLEAGFAAIITPGLELAFEDRESVRLVGQTIRSESAEREVCVCGAGAFVVLKALAFDSRGENKDAYDLIYVLQNYGDDVSDVFARLRPLLDREVTGQALSVLERDFTNIDGPGAMRVAEFLGEVSDEEVRADAVGVVTQLLAMWERAQ